MLQKLVCDKFVIILCFSSPAIILRWYEVRNLHCPKGSTSGTSSTMRFTSNSIYMLMGNCPSFALVSLSREWVYPFSSVDGQTTGIRCLSKYDWCNSVIVLHESNKVGICMPLQPIFLLGHFAMACWIIFELRECQNSIATQSPKKTQNYLC